MFLALAASIVFVWSLLYNMPQHHQHQGTLQKQMIGWEHGQPLFLQNRLGPLHPLCPPIEHLNGTHHHVVGLLVMFVFCNWRAARTSPNDHIPIIQWLWTWDYVIQYPLVQPWKLIRTQLQIHPQPSYQCESLSCSPSHYGYYYVTG